MKMEVFCHFYVSRTTPLRRPMYMQFLSFTGFLCA